jgi:hypothetical protein
LEDADFDTPIIPVSSALAQRDRAVSGLDTLVTQLQALEERSRAVVATDAAAAAHAAIGQLAAPLQASEDALANPAAVLEESTALEARAARFSGSSAEWLLVLEDGISDLEEEVEHAVTACMRTVLDEARSTISHIDPASSWDEFSADLTRRMSAEMAVVSSTFLQGVNDLAANIADQFSAMAPTLPSEVGPTAMDAPVPSAELMRSQWRGALVHAGWGGVEALGVVGTVLSFASVTLINPFSLVIGAFIGGRSVRQARQRERARRQEQALDAVTRYLDEAALDATRRWRSEIRRIRRELRTYYQEQADSLHRSAQAAAAAARAAAGLSPDQRSAMVARLDELRALDRSF